MKITIHHSFLFSFFSNTLYYLIAFPILKIVTKLVYDLKIEGIENIRNIEGPVISVSNHVLVLDCAMVGLSYGAKEVYYTTQQESFEIPVVRHLIKLLHAIPIPRGIKNKKRFIEVINEALQGESCVHFYPEAVLVPYDTNIRPFKSGAFDFAVKNEVPIVPMVFCFREPVGLRKIFKRKKDVTLVILEPITCMDTGEDIKQRVEYLKQETYERMNKVLLRKKMGGNKDEDINKGEICITSNAGFGNE